MKRTYSVSGPYKIRRFANSRPGWEITVPREIVELVGDAREFTCELTDEGILFRPTDKPAPRDVPRWVAGEARSRRRSTPDPTEAFIRQWRGE